MTDSITAFCSISLHVGGNCSCTDYLTVTWLLYFSPSCPNIRANHCSEICCISTWWVRWCRHPLSRSSSSSLSVKFFDHALLTNEWKRKKEKLRFQSIQSNHDRISELFIFSRSSIILFRSFWLIDFIYFHIVELRKKKDERILR